MRYKRLWVGNRYTNPSSLYSPIMDKNSQTFFMIPVSGNIQPQSKVCDLDDPPTGRQSYPSFFPSFLPTWGSMRAGSGIPPMPEIPSSHISEVQPVQPEDDKSDDEMSVDPDKPLARRVCKYILFRMPVTRAELQGLLGFKIECQYIRWWNAPHWQFDGPSQTT